MRILVFGIACFEFVMLATQVVRLLDKPRDKKRLQFLILLLFIFLYNASRLLLPDSRLPIPEIFQLDIAAVITAAMCVYFGFYFYKAFNLNNPHVFLSSTTLLSLPFLSLFLLPDLDTVTRLDILPLIFSSFIIHSVSQLLIKKLRQPGKHDKNAEKLPVIIAAFGALLCWAIVPTTSLLGDFKMLNLLIVNIGFLILTVVYTWCLIGEARENHSRSEQLLAAPPDWNRIEANFIRYKFTEREMEVANKIIARELNREIADSLAISTETVKKHISNISRKLNAGSKSGIIRKLNL